MKSLRPLSSAAASVALLVFAFSGCRRSPAPSPEKEENPLVSPSDPATPSTAEPAKSKLAPTQASKAPKASQPVVAAKPPPAELWKEFSGERAMQEVKNQVDLGPRPSGSPEAEKARALIIAGLKRAGWRVEPQEFTEDTPRGPIRFINLIGRFGQAPGGEHSQAIVCSHYDTKRFSTIRFVGASDGASSTGALIELARVLALDPAFAARVELVFFDGEEALQQFSETDGLYGSRHYAQALREAGRASLFKLGVLWDMIGDKDLTITLPPDSPPELAQGIFASSEMLGSRSHFAFFPRSVLDDHVPLNSIAKIPSIDLIDFDYLPWHTADDTLDKLSPESLRIIGEVTTYFLKRSLPR